MAAVRADIATPSPHRRSVQGLPVAGSVTPAANPSDRNGSAANPDTRLRSPSIADGAIPTAAQLRRDTERPPAERPLAERPLLIGESAILRQLASTAGHVAPRRSTVMVLGETGVGKEMFARTIHHLSDRGEGPMVAVDCSTLTETLFESQMFGHVRGAFTGAVRDSVGFFRAASGGTLFLDEVGELSPVHQAKLLRAIQDRMVIPVGATEPQPADVRLVCATHRDLAGMVKRGEFREDLYFRLNVITLNIPPLRERPEDVLPLMRHFLAAQAAIYDEPIKHLTSEAATAVLRYGWPGNVRELANVAEHLHVMAGEQIALSDLPPHVAKPTQQTPRSNELNLNSLERRAIEQALDRTDGNKSAAARLLGVHTQTLNRRMRKLGVVRKG